MDVRKIYYCDRTHHKKIESRLPRAYLSPKDYRFDARVAQPTSYSEQERWAPPSQKTLTTTKL